MSVVGRAAQAQWRTAISAIRAKSRAGDAGRCWCGRGALEEFSGFGTDSGLLTRRTAKVGRTVLLNLR
jgi:hypothetical protein